MGKKDTVSEFKRLFWAARRAHVKAGRSGSADLPEHKAAVAHSRKHGFKWGEALLGASLLQKQGKHEDALRMLDAAYTDTPVTEQGLLWFVKGAALEGLKQWDDAIKAYREALEDPTFDKPGNAWNNLGLTYHRKGEYDEAIKAHRKALEDPTYDTPANAWNNLGLAYQGKDEYDEAIKAHRKALEDPTYDRPASAWNNLGLAYQGKGEYDEAIKAHRKALEDPTYDTPAHAWHNLGLAYSHKGEYDEAINAYRKALEDPQLKSSINTLLGLSVSYLAAGQNEEAREVLQTALKEEYLEDSARLRAKSFLSILEAEVKEKALSSDDRAVLERAPSTRPELEPEQRILVKIQTAEQSQYEKYLKMDGSKRNNVLSILRGWSSAVTLLEGSERLWRGGGYFLKWQHKEIVIDPGFDFLRNFHDAGYHGREIDAVLVSHNHSDHNADLKSIDDLRYELYKRRHKDPNGAVNPYVLIWDEDTQGALKFSVEEPEHQFRPILFDIGRCTPCDTISGRHELPFSLMYFAVKHGSELHSPVGFKLSLEADGHKVFTLGFTGDTEFFPELSNYLENCDILLAHISQPDSAEFLDSDARKKDHLGYRGLGELIRRSKPKLTIVSEFWAGLSDLRIDLVQGIRKLTGNDHILPAGIGMHVHLPEMEVECTQCGTRVAFNNLRVSPPASRFGDLAYLCPQCVLG